MQKIGIDKLKIVPINMHLKTKMKNEVNIFDNFRSSC